MKKICNVEGCEREFRARGMCFRHWQQWRKTAPEADLEKPTVEARLLAKTRKTSDCWLWEAYIQPTGYGLISYEGSMVGAHKVAYIIYKGEIPEGLHIDHRPTCPKNCVNPDHLRTVTQQQNAENQPARRRNNSSGYQGVHWFTYVGKWASAVRHKGKRYNMGYFPLYELHVAAYYARMKRMELFTHNDLDRAV